MKGLKLRTIVGLFCLVLALAGVLVAHVWKQNAYVRLSMGAVRLAKQQTQLRNDIALLEVSVGGLKKMSRIESLAKGRFGLEYGKTPVLVYMDESPERIGGEKAAKGRMADARGAEGTESGKGPQSGKVAWRTNGL
jgi:cell division protein FtsL